MTDYRVAHINQAGQHMIIIPLDSIFHYRTQQERSAFLSAIQKCVSSAGLAGTVVPVWLHNDRMHFIAPQPWHSFFMSLQWDQVQASLNKKISCSSL